MFASGPLCNFAIATRLDGGDRIHLTTWTSQPGKYKARPALLSFFALFITPKLLDDVMPKLYVGLHVDRAESLFERNRVPESRLRSWFRDHPKVWFRRSVNCLC